MQAENFFFDTAGAMDATDPETGGNTGLLQRFSLTALGNELVLEGSLYHDLCQQNRPILNNVCIGVKLFPSLDAFRLMANDDDAYKVIVTDATLNVCHVKIYPEVILAHDEALKQGPAIYPINQSQIITHSIAKGSFNFAIDDVYNGDVPSQIIIGLVSSQAYAASYKKNYANFDKFGLNYLQFTIDGNSASMKPFQPNYKVGNYAASYLSLFSLLSEDKGIGITQEDYPNGYCLYAINCGETQEGLTSEVRKGHTRLSITFSEALKESITIIIYSQTPKVVSIDRARNVILP